MPTGLFIGAGYNGIRVVSPDGVNWSAPVTGKEGEIYRAVSFGNGLCVAAGSYGGSNIFASTRDGAAWKLQQKDAGYVKFVRGTVFAKGRFYGLGGDGGAVGAAQPFAINSEDGDTWSNYAEISGNFLLRRAAFGNGLLVAVGDRGRRSVSSDGKEWKDNPNTRPLDTLVDVAFGNGVFIGVGLHGLRMRTQDGITWTDRQLGEEGEHLNSIVWTGSQFAAIGMGATYFSPNGQTWTRKPNHNFPLTATFGNGIFAGTQWKGRLLTSTDAIEWRETLKCPHHIEAIGFGIVG